MLLLIVTDKGDTGMRRVLRVMIVLCLIAGCGMSEEERVNTATYTCNVMGESRNMDAAFRIKELNAARTKIGGSMYLGTDDQIKESFEYGLCLSLVLEDSYEEKLKGRKEAEKVAAAERAEERRIAAEKKAEEERIAAAKKAEADRIAAKKKRKQIVQQRQNSLASLLNTKRQQKQNSQNTDSQERRLIVIPML